MRFESLNVARKTNQESSPWHDEIQKINTASAIESNASETKKRPMFPPDEEVLRIFRERLQKEKLGGVQLEFNF
jgi:hypothetical protein